MDWMKRTALAMAAGAAFLFSPAPASAASVGQAAGQATEAATAQSDSNVIAVRREFRGHRGGRFYGGYGGRRHYGGYGGRRYGHWRGRHHRGFRWGWGAPLIVAPFAYGAYGYGYGNSCYRECRAYRGPNYCRYNWRRYC